MSAQFEHPDFPREIADAPDIENIPAASSMHALMECVTEIYHGVRQIQDALSPETQAERMRAIAPLAMELAREFEEPAPSLLDQDGDDDGREAAPLDPSKVKAGDTVKIAVKFENPEFRDFTLTGEVYNAMEGGGLYVGGWPLLGHTQVTLLTHQPAPEPEPEWKRGTIGTAGTVRGLGYTGPVVRTDEHPLPWWTPSRVDGAHYHGEETVTDFVPDEPRPLPTRGDLARVMHDDYLPNGEPRLGRTHREILADAVLAHLRGESR